MDFYLLSHMKQVPAIEALVSLRETPSKEAYFAAFSELLFYLKNKAVTDQPLRELIIHASLCGASFGDFIGSSSLDSYLTQDVEAVYDLAFSTRWKEITQSLGVLSFPEQASPVRENQKYKKIMTAFTEAKSPEQLKKAYLDFYSQYADLKEAQYTAFRWEDGVLVGLSERDRVSFDSLGGLETQKAALIENTTSFLQGKPANNILLVGSSGSGKSSCVKANLNYFAEDGLKMVELGKQDLPTLPELMEVLRNKRCHYIIYIDDLSFEEADLSYIGLKVALEGQLEPKPRHVLIYATSNRRRLMRETWADRQGVEDVHTHDTLHEKMSLSERFGIRLYFGVLSQQEYFNIIEMMLEPYQIPFTDELGVQAATWATANNGRSGRTARQFVNDYLASVL